MDLSYESEENDELIKELLKPNNNTGFDKINQLIKNSDKNKSKFVNGKVVGDTQLIDILDAGIIKKNIEEQQVRGEKSGRFYPYMLGSNCDKLLYLSYNGLLPIGDGESDGRILRIFDNGHSLESRYFAYFVYTNIHRQSEVSAIYDVPPIYISGRTDFVIRLPNNKNDMLLELKSINNNGFGKLNGPKSEHLIQLQLYLNILDVTEGIVLYENKDNQKLKEFHIKKDKNIWVDILNRCNKIINMKSVPKPPSVSVHSQYCNCLYYKV